MEKSNKATTNKKADTKTRSQKKDLLSKRKKKNQMLRIVIRQLPPTITQDNFVNDVSPLAEHTELYLARGDLDYKEFNFSSVYITFKKFEDVLRFKERFDGYVFVDDKGNEYTAQVEFSPLRKMPDFDGLKMKEDPKLNTIETDPEYLEFAEALKQPISKNGITPDTILEEIQNRNAASREPQITPLMEYILARRSEDRRKKDNKKREERKKREDKRAKKKAETKNNGEKGDKKDDKKDVPKGKEVKVLKRPKAKPEPKTDGPQFKILAKSTNMNGKDAKIQSTSATKATDKAPSNKAPAQPVFTVKVKNEHREPSSNAAHGSTTSTTNKPPKQAKEAQRVKNKDRPEREIYKPKHVPSTSAVGETTASTEQKAITLNDNKPAQNSSTEPATKKRTYRTYIRHKNKPANSNNPAVVANKNVNAKPA